MSKDTSQIWYAARHWRLGFFYVPSLTRHWSRLPNLIIGRTPAHDSSTAGLEPTTLPSRVLRATLTRPLLFYGSCISEHTSRASHFVRINQILSVYIVLIRDIWPNTRLWWLFERIVAWSESERILVIRKPTVIFEPASNFQVVDFYTGYVMHLDLKRASIDIDRLSQRTHATEFAGHWHPVWSKKKDCRIKLIWYRLHPR